MKDIYQENLNNDLIIKKINNSTDYKWVISLLKSKQKLNQKTLNKIKNINNLEVQNFLNH